jgi:hypothetical protein
MNRLDGISQGNLPTASSALHAEEVDHLLFGRKDSSAVFGIDHSITDDNVENPSAAANQLDMQPQLSTNSGFQPGSLGQVVSLHAIGDDDFH